MEANKCRLCPRAGACSPRWAGTATHQVKPAPRVGVNVRACTRVCWYICARVLSWEKILARQWMSASMKDCSFPVSPLSLLCIASFLCALNNLWGWFMRTLWYAALLDVPDRLRARGWKKTTMEVYTTEFQVSFMIERDNLCLYNSHVYNFVEWKEIELWVSGDCFH